MSSEFDGIEPSHPSMGPGWLVDTHAHLADKAFDADRDAVIARAMDQGVRLIVAVGFDLESSRASLDLARGREGIVAAVGIHPHEAGRSHATEMAEIRAWAVDPQVVAIGETGLDYYRNQVPRQEQIALFEAHLAIADEADKPVIVHDREAHADVQSILFPWAASRVKAGKRSRPGVLHCFTGDLAMAEAAIAAGFLVSLAGNVTFPSARALVDVARRLDLGSLVLETDCPYLAPTPLRGRRNEPANVLVSAAWLAEARAIPLAEVAAVTSSNARRLFGLA